MTENKNSIFIKQTLEFIRDIYGNEGNIYLHEPVFNGKEREYVLEAIDSTFVSSVGPFVNKFESDMAKYTGAKHAVAVVNGTAALHISLLLAGVQRGDLVITQAVSFIATCNAISYIGAEPAFVDIDADTLGLSPVALGEFLKEDVKVINGKAVHQPTGRTISACVPMHTFGFPARIDEIVKICHEYGITVVEDAAESIGSFYKGQHTGTFGKLGTFSFNGNKTITCGGGGMIVTNDEVLAKKAKHLTTQAKTPHRWEFSHDHIGYNYRCPNINAALACAQLEQLEIFIENKRNTSKLYSYFFESTPYQYISEPKQSRSNYWLNAILFKNRNERDAFLEYSNNSGVMTRPIWNLLHQLPMFTNCINDGLDTSINIEARLVNLPSSVIPQ